MVLNRFPALKKFLKWLRDMLPGRSVSSHYVELDPADADETAGRLRAAWKAEVLPKRQRDLVNRQLEAYRHGLPVDVFDVLVRTLADLPGVHNGASLLEIGCASGYYSEVLEIAGLSLQYTGCDYSEALIAMAQCFYPSRCFDVADATALHYPDNAFDIVISGCCLLHIPEYEQAVSEAVRVARDYVIFHRTPVVVGQPTRYFRKLAYDVETVEIHFGEPQFLTLLHKHGLELIDCHTLSEEHDPEHPQRISANRTYVCRKIST